MYYTSEIRSTLVRSFIKKRFKLKTVHIDDQQKKIADLASTEPVIVIWVGLGTLLEEHDISLAGPPEPLIWQLHVHDHVPVVHEHSVKLGNGAEVVPIRNCKRSLNLIFLSGIIIPVHDDLKLRSRSLKVIMNSDPDLFKSDPVHLHPCHWSGSSLPPGNPQTWPGPSSCTSRFSHGGR